MLTSMLAFVMPKAGFSRNPFCQCYTCGSTPSSCSSVNNAATAVSKVVELSSTCSDGSASACKRALRARRCSIPLRFPAAGQQALAQHSVPDLHQHCQQVRVAPARLGEISPRTIHQHRPARRQPLIHLQWNAVIRPLARQCMANAPCARIASNCSAVTPWAASPLASAERVMTRRAISPRRLKAADGKRQSGNLSRNPTVLPDISTGLCLIGGRLHHVA